MPAANDHFSVVVLKIAASPHVLPHVPIDRSSGTALHRQVYDGLRKAILDGMLRPGGGALDREAARTDPGAFAEFCRGAALGVSCARPPVRRR